VLKKAEGVNDVIPRNLTAAGGRAWRQGDGITPEQYGQISARNKDWFPEARTEFIWIAGMLSSTGITVNVDFNTIAEDGKYTPDAEKYPAMTLAEWKKLHINFSPQSGNVATHEEYLNYFDENDIYVYLQVESGFADMETLIDIYYDVFNVAGHKCVLGFAVDVEWYYGVETDQGIPVSDGRAKEWAEYLYETWGRGKAALVLKHYNATHLPLTYRGGEEGKSEKLVFCNDSQNLASWDGSVGAVWDADTTKGGTASGMGRAFKLWADFYPDNKILYQVGYSGDMQWIYPMDGDIVRTMGIKLAEAASAGPDQEIAIAWVNFTYNDPLTFGDITSPSVASKAGQIHAMLASLSSTGSVTGENLPGQRFDGARTADKGGTGATYTDAMLVARLRELVDSLPDGEAGPNELSGGSLTQWNERVARLKEVEPMALDIRIEAVLSAGEAKPLRDRERVQALYEAYERFDDAQKAVTGKADELLAACEALGIN
jgi:hypothetical protein